MIEKGRKPDLLLLKNFIRMRKKELSSRSFVGKNGGGTSTRDIMNQKHQWSGIYENVDFIDDLPNSKMNTRLRAEEYMSFYADFHLFLKTLTSNQRHIIDLLMSGFGLNQICKRLRRSDFKIRQISDSVKEACLKYFEIELQLMY